MQANLGPTTMATGQKQLIVIKILTPEKGSITTFDN